ncbi:NAD(P)-binding domain-containing protein [Microbacterium sp. BWT-B31]|uniref:NAD(P)-binding domain-containing protein n=1 Tax=Microbacterium sp. BWT-B31 TaxID=3232072 RepID=UPI0035290F6E
MLLLNGAATRAALAEADLRPRIAEALQAMAADEAHAPARLVARAPGGLIAAMPAYVPRLGLAAKVVSVFADAGATRHRGVVALFDEATGVLRCLIDAEELTAARTAATAALAIDALAPHARSVAIVGTGRLARAVGGALADSAELVICGRSRQAAQAAAAECRGRAAAIPEAVTGAEVVVLATSATQPVIEHRWLRAGALVVSLGGSEGCEVDSETVAAARIVVEWHGAWREPPPAGAHELQGLDPGRARLLGDFIDDPETSRGLTLFKSTGTALVDVAAAASVWSVLTERPSAVPGVLSVPWEAGA